MRNTIRKKWQINRKEPKVISQTHSKGKREQWDRNQEIRPSKKSGLKEKEKQKGSVTKTDPGINIQGFSLSSKGTL